MCTHIEDVVYCSFHWMLHVIDLRENCVYVLDSLRSKVNEDIHGIINVQVYLLYYFLFNFLVF